MSSLPAAPSALAVCAHPDDKSFGLGAALAAFAAHGTPTAVLCLTHGAASALGTSHGDLHQIPTTGKQPVPLDRAGECGDRRQSR